MKRIHYLLLGLLVSLSIAAVSPSLPPTRIAPGSNITIVTNGVNSFTISSAAGGAGAQLDGTNVFTGTNRFSSVVIATNTANTFAGSLIASSSVTNLPAITVETGVIRANDGSALAPAYSFSSSTNTGIWSSGGSLIFGTPNKSVSGYFQGSNGKLVLEVGLEVQEDITLFASYGSPMGIQRSGTNLMLVPYGLGAVTMTNLIATNFVTSSLWVGPGGTTITNYASATATLNFASILAAGYEDLSITVTGAVVNDTVTIGLPATVLAGAIFNAWVSAANTVTVRCNNAGSIAVDPASATYRVGVTSH
jgi:hypothetical protein